MTFESFFFYFWEENEKKKTFMFYIKSHEFVMQLHWNY